MGTQPPPKQERMIVGKVGLVSLLLAPFLQLLLVLSEADAAPTMYLVELEGEQPAQSGSDFAKEAGVVARGGRIGRSEGSEPESEAGNEDNEKVDKEDGNENENEEDEEENEEGDEA